MAGVDAGINMLLRDGWTQRTPSLLRMMKSSITRMAGLVDNVMDLARARMGGGIVLKPDESRDIAETLHQVIEEFRVAHPDRDIQSTHEVFGTVEVDHARIAQMFSNLLGNALTHGDIDAPVSVHTSLNADRFSLTVANGGVAIPKEAIERLFQPFQRGKELHGEGLGLGLYIASEIAKAHGGTLSLESDETSTRFTFLMAT
jgi:signal transduction histidine kinase